MPSQTEHSLESPSGVAVAAAAAVRAEPPRAPPHRLQMVCSEVWGGNRPIHTPVELPGLRGVLYSHPSEGGRGGDVHYLSVCGSGLLARVCVADVVGHGQAVARVSAEIHALLRRYMNWTDQRTVLSRLNRRLEQVGLGAMTTAAIVTYYPPPRSLSFSYAGHPPGWIYRRREGRWSRLTIDERRAARGVTDLPLAVEGDVRYSRQTEQVNVGDRLLLVTDGVLEAPTPDGLFGAERVEATLARCGDAGPERLASALLDALSAAGGPAAFASDDITFLALEIVPGPKGPPLWHVIKNRIFRPRGNSAAPEFAVPVAAAP